MDTSVKEIMETHAKADGPNNISIHSPPSGAGVEHGIVDNDSMASWRCSCGRASDADISVEWGRHENP